MNTKTQFNRFRLRQSGFTLIEIMVVVIIIGLLSTIILPKVFSSKDRAFEVKAKNDIGQYSGALQMYKLDNYEFPTSSEGLQSLVTNPGKRTWRGYMDRIQKDPWDNEYQYAFPGTRNPNSFDLWSLGSDNAPGGEGTAKDIGNWQEEQ